MQIDRAIFFAQIRRTLFGGRLEAGQVEGMEAVLARISGKTWCDPRWLAYMLATAHHETAGRMLPVRETLAQSDEEAVARLERAFRAGKLPTVKTPYWRRDGEGRSYYGRGLVQITHQENYLRLGRVVKLDLVNAPDLALRLDVAVEILVVGMQEGLFSGRKLSDYLNGTRSDFIGARRIINGRDRAKKIAASARAFDAAIRAALKT